EFIALEAVTTSVIEGENLDANSVRSSIAKQLGLPSGGLPVNSVKTDGLVEILLDATHNYSDQLTNERIYSWHAALFPTGYSGMNKINSGNYRTGSEPMEVVSGIIGNSVVHFKAPESESVPGLMNNFILWWNNEKSLDGIIKAAVSHLYFLTIHPFDDGNGRIARVLTDMTLAADEKNGRRLYSLSPQILKNKSEYYQILEETQKGDGDITKWIIWFLSMYLKAIESSLDVIEKTISINRLKTNLIQFELNERQKKVIIKLIENWPNGFKDGISNKKYVSIAKTTPETAKRDLKKLVELGLLKRSESGGRSTAYLLEDSNFFVYFK
ncbi:MAG: Fic family protein, partial [Spirochaetales bacterium]|nr:Fic family protein [Spirochaetales bacterium]